MVIGEYNKKQNEKMEKLKTAKLQNNVNVQKQPPKLAEQLVVLIFVCVSLFYNLFKEKAL